MTEWSTNCTDWEARIVAGNSIIPSPIFPAQADEALAIFKGLRIADVAGQPTFGEACEPYVFDFVAAIFGAYDADEGVRLIDEFFLLIAKKNIKSTMAAGIMVTALVLNWRHYAELLILAPTIEIAKNSYEPAAAMVRADPELSLLMHVQDHIRHITNRKTNAVLKVVAADTETVGGKKAGFILIEEAWLFGQKPKTAKMLQEATGGQISRPEGFTIWITTHADEPPTGVFKTKLNYARNVRDGIIDDPKFLPVLFEFPAAMLEDESYLDPQNWYVTNPNMGRSVNADWISRKLAQIEAGEGEDGESAQSFIAKHLNVEIGNAKRNDRWAGVDFWAEAVDKTLDLKTLLARSDVVTLGIDGGGLDDLLGFAVIGREKVTRRWLVWTKAWAHPIVLKRRKEIATTLLEFSRDGDLVFCETPRQDIEEISAICVDVRGSGKLPERDAIGVDKMGLPAIVDQLVTSGFTLSADGGQITGIAQGGYLNDAILGVERKLSDQSLIHADQRMMDWVVGNAKIEMKGSSASITKAIAGRAKIDPLVALLNAAKLMSLNPEAKREPTYQMIFVR